MREERDALEKQYLEEDIKRIKENLKKMHEERQKRLSEEKNNKEDVNIKKLEDLIGYQLVDIDDTKIIVKKDNKTEILYIDVAD